MKIHELVARLRRMSLHEQIWFLQAELRKEKPYSVRGNEIQSLLDGKMLKQLRKEMVHRTSAPASAPIGHQEAERVSA